MGAVLAATCAGVSTPARAQKVVPPPAQTAIPAPPPAPTEGVLVHIATPNEVDLEVRRGSDWVPICTSPCDRYVRPGDSYRVASDAVPASNVFAITPQPQVTLRVDPSTKQSRVGGIVFVILGAAGFVPGGLVTVGVASFFLGGAILVCPIAAAFGVDYGNCVVGAAGLVTPYYASPYVWGPAIGGVVLLTAGVVWLASTAGGHPTNVTTGLLPPPPAPVFRPLAQWHTLEMSQGALPPPATVPVLSASF
jgi:hypothetical protein